VIFIKRLTLSTVNSFDEVGSVYEVVNGIYVGPSALE
jgi:hypothetical protein